MQVGMQLMPGLPGETSRSFLRGISEAIRSRRPLSASIPPWS